MAEPELLDRSDTEEDLEPSETVRERVQDYSDNEEDEEEELSDEEIERRRQALRQRARVLKQMQEEVLHLLPLFIS